MKLSIIIPVYNVEKYILRCIDSCINQHCLDSDYEIIIIDDGSTDNSLSLILNKYKNESNVKILTQNNIGLGATRNRGIREAIGDYICFVDTDDWIEKNILESILLILDKVYDVIQIPFIKAYDDSKNNEVVIQTTFFVEPKRNISSHMIFPAQFYIVRRDFLKENNINFVEGIFHEDVEYTPRILYLAKSISFFYKPAYFFYKRANSITTTYNIKRSFDYIKVAHSLDRFSDSFDKEFYSIFSKIIALAINNALYNAMNTNLDNRSFYASLISNKKLFYRMFYSRSVKYIIEGGLFVIFPKKISFIYQILNKL